MLGIMLAWRAHDARNFADELPSRRPFRHAQAEEAVNMSFAQEFGA